jgi:hypothetical protein
LQEQISMSILRINAQADQALVDMLIQNTKRIQALSNTANGHVDLFA